MVSPDPRSQNPHSESWAHEERVPRGWAPQEVLILEMRNRMPEVEGREGAGWGRRNGWAHCNLRRGFSCLQLGTWKLGTQRWYRPWQEGPGTIHPPERHWNVDLL